MNPYEFAAKVDWEGGLYEALFGYGLKSSDVDDEYPELKTALDEAHSAHAEFSKYMDAVEALLPEDFE